MVRVFSTETLALAWHVKNLLEFHGIDAEIRNDQLGAGVGEMPVDECLVEVWVRRPLDARRAEEVVDEMLFDDVEDEESWLCGHCGERNDGIFALCWHCQHPADGDGP